MAKCYAALFRYYSPVPRVELHPNLRVTARSRPLRCRSLRQSTERILSRRYKIRRRRMATT